MAGQDRNDLVRCSVPYPHRTVLTSADIERIIVRNFNVTDVVKVLPVEPNLFSRLVRQTEFSQCQILVGGHNRHSLRM
jgi:hypothetical protein